MKNKALTWGLLALLIAMMALAAACSADNNKGATGGSNSSGNDAGQAPADRSEYVIQVLATPNNANISRSDQTAIGKVVKEKFNIVFEFIPFTGDYRNRLNLMLAGGDYPELLRIERNDLVTKYIQAGALLPLDDYVADAPDFRKRYSGLFDLWKMPSPDDKLYKWENGVPQDLKNRCECFDMVVRTDVLEQQGWPNLMSTNDYIAFLKKGLQDNPTTGGKPSIGIVIPMAESWGTAGLIPILYEKGGRYFAVGNEGIIYNAIEKRYEHMLTNEYTKESYQFFNDLYREGLLTDESFTDNLAQMTEKVNSGQALSVYYVNWVHQAANRNFEAAGQPELQYIAMPIRSALQTERGEKRQIRMEDSRPFESMVITKNAKHPERIFELVNWAASEEGQLLLQSGIEGVHYVVESGKRKPTAAYIQNLQSDPDYLIKEGLANVTWSMFGSLGLTQVASEVDGQPYNLLTDVNLADELNATDRMREAYEKLGWEHSLSPWYETGVASPAGVATAITIDPASEIGAIHQQMTQLRIQYTGELIQARDDAQFEKVWGELLQKYEQLNPQRVVDEYNRLFQEEMAKING